MNANALLVTSNIKDFENPSHELGFEVLQPHEFIVRLIGGNNE
jgi:hypothetical protein